MNYTQAMLDLYQNTIYLEPVYFHLFWSFWLFLFLKNGQNIYFAKHLFSFQHIQNSQLSRHLTTVKVILHFFFILQNIILISKLIVSNVSIQILIPTPTHLKWSTILPIPNKNGQNDYNDH